MINAFWLAAFTVAAPLTWIALPFVALAVGGLFSHMLWLYLTTK